MTETNVEFDALQNFGRNTDESGTTLSVESQHGEFDTVVMTGVFGLIGADFMAVAALVTDTHNRQVGYLGQRYSDVGRAVSNAANGFANAERENTQGFTGADKIDVAKSLGSASSSLAKGLDPSSQSLTREQVAKIIIDRGHKMGMSDDEIKSALATGIVESNLQNIAGGDRDSTGVFQQRDSAQWTSNGRNRTNVDDAATSYYERLRGTTGTPAERAQEVQQSALPERYAEEMGSATALFTQLNNGGAVAATADTTAPPAQKSTASESA